MILIGERMNQSGLNRFWNNVQNVRDLRRNIDIKSICIIYTKPLMKLT